MDGQIPREHSLELSEMRVAYRNILLTVYLPRCSTLHPSLRKKNFGLKMRMYDTAELRFPLTGENYFYEPADVFMENKN